MENIVLVDSKGSKTIYDVLFSFDMNEKSYVVYTDSQIESDEEIKVYYGSYVDGDISKLRAVENEEEIKIIDDIVKDYEEALKGIERI